MHTINDVMRVAPPAELLQRLQQTLQPSALAKIQADPSEALQRSNNLVGLRPTVPLVSRFGMLPARPTTDTLGPITRTVRDAAVLLDVIAGYDPHDRITASSVGHIPTSYRASLTSEGLKGARLGIIREPMNPKADPTSDDYKRFRAVTDRAIRDLKLLGAETLDPLTIPDLKDRIRKLYEGNVFETEQAIDNYFVQHANAPVKSLAEILRSGKIVPARATTLRSNLGRSINETGYLKPPAPSRRDAAACAGPHGG